MKTGGLQKVQKENDILENDRESFRKGAKSERNYQIWNFDFLVAL